MNPLIQLHRAGQSPWYDYISRQLLTSGQLQTLIEKDGLMGMTSNPSIFHNAITGSTDYDEAMEQAASQVTSVKQIFECAAIQDIQDAADLMRPVYDETEGRDGYVSLEVSPDLAFDTQATIDEAVRLYQTVGRDNIMIKVPGTPEGLPAIEELLSQGININVTLLFSVTVYEQVAWSYIRGLKRLAAHGGNLSRMASVASFFVSRIDTLVDKRLKEKLNTISHGEERAVLEGLQGKVAIANAKLAYQKFQEIFSGSEFEFLKAEGARVQRLLWASTGTKNPSYPDTYYVDNLIGPDTVNTMPEATFAAFRDHGTVKQTIEEGLVEAKETMQRLEAAGISMEEVTETLLKDGARLFKKSFDDLLGAVSRKRAAVLGSKLDRLTYAVGPFQKQIEEKLAEFREDNFVWRLWAKDPALWHHEPAHHRIITHALGWLQISREQLPHIPRLLALAEEIKSAGFQHVLILGMGGSSLCPEVCRMSFGIVPGYPELHVLDSTVPAQVQAFEQRLDLKHTLCVVASKSGSTTEPLVFYKYFFDRMQQVIGDRAGEHFMAITDPGSLLEQMAQDQQFRHIFPGDPEIGGRYSALSNFGMVPAALMGVNVEHLLYRAERMRHSCGASVPPQENPGVILGTILGVLAQAGKDKFTFVLSPQLWDLGAWLEQLVAESTGKEGKGIIPIDGESVGGPEVYGQDRLFAYLRHEEGIDEAQEKAVNALERAGHPVIRIHISDIINLGEQFFLWEMATAVAGTILGINAFDQPNVQESKDYTKKYLDAFSQSGKLPDSAPVLKEGNIAVYADQRYVAVLKHVDTLEHLLRAHLTQLKAGDYFGMNAYIEHTPEADQVFGRIRTHVRKMKQVATTLGYGPRFLHSTGQLHKGGPNTGVFIQITADDRNDLAIPGEVYTFGTLKDAQALGDMQSLTSRGRRVIRVHLGRDVGAGLARLEQVIASGLDSPAS